MSGGRMVCYAVLAAAICANPEALAADAAPKKLPADRSQTSDFIPARVGWDPAEFQTAPPVNPVYELMRRPWTAAGLRSQLLAFAIPDWRVFSLFGLLIFTLRYYRYRKPRQQEPGMVVAFPRPPAREAA